MRLALGMFAALLLAATPVSAQFNCGPRAVIVKQLKEKFHEQSGGMGLSRGVLFEIWSAPMTGTFKDWSFKAAPSAPNVYW